MGSEKDILNNIMLLATRLSARLFRNNIGSYKSHTGHYIKYGVCNPGGSDLIGWTRVKITDEHVGKTIAVFTAIEVKTENVKPTKEQLNFINVVRASGGYAGIAYDLEEAQTILEGDYE